MNTEILKSMGACEEGVSWAATQPNAATAWRECKRGDWMLWLLGKLSGKPGSTKHKRLVLACCECARLSLKHVKAGEERPRIAIETAEQWARGDGTTIEDVRDAAAAAWAYAAAAYAADAADAADAAASAAVHAAGDAAAAYAAYAAYAASATTTAAADAAADAAAAAVHAAYADAAAARTGVLSECADIVRRHYPKPPTIRKEKKP